MSSTAPTADERSQAGPVRSRRRFWSRFLVSTAAVLLVVVGIGAWLTLREGRSLARDQREYGATVIACELVGQFVDKSGSWPKSWADLESLPGREFASMGWPRDEAEIRSLVEIDFGTTVAGALAQRPDEFAAVRMRSASGVFNPAPIYRSFQERLAHAGKK